MRARLTACAPARPAATRLAAPRAAAMNARRLIRSPRAGPTALSRSLERDDAPAHALVGPVRHHAPRRQDLQALAFDLEGTDLFGADPLRIPGHLDARRPLVAIEPVSAGVGDERAQEVGALAIGLAGLARLSGQHEEDASVGKEGGVAGGALSHHRP